MNAVEIEQAISDLSGLPFDGFEFAYQFLAAFGNKKTTLKRLRSGNNNRSDIQNGVLQRNNIHIAVCDEGGVATTLAALKASPETSKAKAKFILATDGNELQAEDVISSEIVACDYADFPNHFGFFLPLAGITTVKQIRNNPIDIQATSRLNSLYVELLKSNEDWATTERQHDMNQFMARLIFCFFAEDTEIFNQNDLFIKTIEQMSDSRSDNTDFVLRELFRAMDTPIADRNEANLNRWADSMPYVNGGLFSGTRDVPKFSRISRSYLLHAGRLNWREINPDIFGSMIQAVADDAERGSLGMHYTSVPNILKVLNPLFLDDLYVQLKEAEDNGRKLLNLKKRMTRMRVFDPACGSGNFLVIAYKKIREIEFEINQLRGEEHMKSEIPLSNFRGIELREFPAEIARLALIITEFQCDVLYRGQKEALKEFLPLDRNNWIVCGNALRLDWLCICPPTGIGVKYVADDFFHTPLNQPQIDFENEGGETFICSNPPYLGNSHQSPEQKSDLKAIFGHRIKKWRSLDYVAGWFMKAVDYGSHSQSASAFVSTNSICQGQQVPILWPLIFNNGHEISFAYTSFKWANLAAHNAGVTVAIVGLSIKSSRKKYLFNTENEQISRSDASNISPYLHSGSSIFVQAETTPINFSLAKMIMGNMSVDGGNLLLDRNEIETLGLNDEQSRKWIRRFYGSKEFIRGLSRYCLWIEDDELDSALANPQIKERIDNVRNIRLKSPDKGANKMAGKPHQFREMNSGTYHTFIVPRVSSERRYYLPTGLLMADSNVADSAFALYNAPIWNMALIASHIHLIWIKTVCGQLETRLRYSKSFGWNTFPVPKLTDKNKADLTRCAEDILLARESHFPATIAELYDPDKMPNNLRAAHDRNDEVLERIYIGRLFKNDTERLNKLFELYTKMRSPNVQEITETAS